MEPKGKYFKVVAVLRKKRIEYSFIPYQWETENVLFWPQANLTTLRCDPESKPETDWKKYPCKVKKTNIFGLEEAQLWEQQFVEEGTDTEGPPNSLIASSNKLTSLKNINKTDLDYAFDAINIRTVTDKKNPEPIIFLETRLPASNCDNQHSNIMVPLDVDTDNNLNEDILVAEHTSEHIRFDSGSSLGNIVHTTNIVEQKLDIIIENQKRLTEKIESEHLHQRAITDKIYKMLKEIMQKKEMGHYADEEKMQEDALSQKFSLPLGTVEDMFAFNKELINNIKFKNHMIKTYTAVGGTDGNEDGKTVGKKLRVIFFTEHVLTSFSWTGMSRTAGLAKKESFQVCDGIIKLFLDLLKLADDRWSSSKNENFFKYNTLKHAKQIENAFEKKKKKVEEKNIEEINKNIEEKTIDPDVLEITEVQEEN